MYLSEYLMDAKLSVNPYEIHRELWKVFPGMPLAQRPFLFRWTKGKRGDPLRVLMLSSVEPDGIGLFAAFALLRKREFNPCFRQGQTLRFMLRANPVKCLSGERCRVPLIKEEEQVEWLKRKLSGAAEPLDAQPVAKDIMYFRKKGMVGKIIAVTYTGILQVKSPEGFMGLIHNGIGPAKSFGCGMLTVARA